MKDETYQSTPKKQRQMMYWLVVALLFIMLGCNKNELPDRPAETSYTKIDANTEYIAVYDSQFKMSGIGEYSILVNNKEIMSGKLTTSPTYTDYIIFKGDKYKINTVEQNSIYRAERE